MYVDLMLPFLCACLCLLLVAYYLCVQNPFGSRQVCGHSLRFRLVRLHECGRDLGMGAYIRRC